MYNTLKYNV